MDLLHSLRRRRDSLGRVLGGVFAATWLGLAVQPCMAHAESQVPDMGGAASHANHHDDHSGTPAPATPHCPHCPPAADAGHDCTTGAALECASVAAPALPSKASEAPAAGALPALPVMFEDPAPAISELHLAQSPVDTPHPAGPTFQQRYCRQLK